MHAYFLLSLPRLHPELASLPEGCRTLWPGLPRRPEHAWAPELPWPPALAQACLADYERACRDGASGAPVHALGAEHAPADLSDAERRALREMAGMPAEEPEQPLRQTAQQVLLLTWLQEKQALDMAELEKKISASRRELAGLLSGRTRVGEASFLPRDNDLPDWKKTLAAALAFLPDMPENIVVLAKPKNLDISTAWVYKNYNPQRVVNNPCIWHIAECITSGAKAMTPFMGNVLETVTIPANPQIAIIKMAMLKAGAYFSMMSGSGPTVFAFAETKEIAENIVDALKDFNVETAITTTVGRKNI